MRIFDFSEDVTDKIIDEIRLAETRIRIALFQIQHPGFFEVLQKAMDHKVKVEIITLPPESVKETIRERVKKSLHELQKHENAKVYFCRWNVGTTSRTRTSTTAWYSYHGKIIVTERSAIATSANFTDKKELESLIIFRDDAQKIRAFDAKFEQLRHLFVTTRPDTNIEDGGTIRQTILQTKLPNVEHVFELPKEIKDEHAKYWILHYPFSLCPKITEVSDGLYLVPFDCRGRDFLSSAILQAQKFLCLSTETFSDPSFPTLLIRVALRGVDVKALSGDRSIDFQNRMDWMVREFLANNIGIRTVKGSIHGKLLVTDKHLIVSSININKIGLGFESFKGYWRENTETILVCSDRDIIKEAQEKYLKIYDEGAPIGDKLAKKTEDLIKELLDNTLELSLEKRARESFSKVVIAGEIETKRLVIGVGKILQDRLKVNGKISRIDFFSALILYRLEQNQRTLDELQKELNQIDSTIDVQEILGSLLLKNLIEAKGDYYNAK